jgi:hypothetical protein
MAKLKNLFKNSINQSIDSNYIYSGTIPSNKINTIDINQYLGEGQYLGGGYISTTSTNPTYGLQAEITALKKQLGKAQERVHELEQELQAEREKMIEI